MTDDIRQTKFNELFITYRKKINLWISKIWLKIGSNKFSKLSGKVVLHDILISLSVGMAFFLLWIAQFMWEPEVRESRREGFYLSWVEYSIKAQEFSVANEYADDSVSILALKNMAKERHDVQKMDDIIYKVKTSYLINEMKWYYPIFASFFVTILMFFIFVFWQVKSEPVLYDSVLFTGPMKLFVVIYGIVTTSAMLFFVWHRHDIYYIWTLIYFVVIAAFMDSLTEPLPRVQMKRLKNILSEYKTDSNAFKCSLSFIDNRISQEMQAKAWTLLGSFALGLTLVIGALGFQREQLTVKGFNALVVEYFILSVYGWIIAIGGIFFRYNNRAKKLQNLLTINLQKKRFRRRTK